jgi:hypothetical protein
VEREYAFPAMPGSKLIGSTAPSAAVAAGVYRLGEINRPLSASVMIRTLAGIVTSCPL